MKYHGLGKLKKEILRFLVKVDSVDDHPVFFSPILIKHNLEIRGVRERSYTSYSHQLLELEQQELVTRRHGSGANYCISKAGREVIAELL